MDEQAKAARKDKVKTAEIALRELTLSVVTEADRARIHRVERGLRALDDEQAAAKTERDAAVARVERLQALLREVLKAWKWEADQGDGINERHSALYLEAKRFLSDAILAKWGGDASIPGSSFLASDGSGPPCRGCGQTPCVELRHPDPPDPFDGEAER